MDRRALGPGKGAFGDWRSSAEATGGRIPDNGAVSAHLATERALELFAPVQQADYVGWNGSGVGPKGQDDTLLAGYEIVDDPLGAQNVVPTADEDGEVCLHTEIEPYETSRRMVRASSAARSSDCAARRRTPKMRRKKASTARP